MRGCAAAAAQGPSEPGAPERGRQWCQGEVNSSSLTLPGHRTDLQKSGVNRPRQHRGRLTNALTVAIGAESFRVAAGARDEQTTRNSIRRFRWIYQALARRGIDLPSLARAAWKKPGFNTEHSLCLLPQLTYCHELLENIGEIPVVFFLFTYAIQMQGSAAHFSDS